jgi:pantetheine-phosphate adenylyltransferase
MKDKIAIYPGSFNPFTVGHQDILDKAMMVFDFVFIVVAVNPDKGGNKYYESAEDFMHKTVRGRYQKKVQVVFHNGLLAPLANRLHATAVIRGLRDGKDFEYELGMQYWNEDLGISIPTVFFAADRNLRHMSSSAVRSLEPFMEEPDCAALDIHNNTKNIMYWKHPLDKR